MGRAVLAVALLAFCLAAADPQGPALNRVLAVPDKAFPKAQQPQVTIDPTGKIHLVFGAENSIYCTTSADGGKTYAAPVKVGSVGSLALGMRRGPRVVAAEKAVLVTAIGGDIGRGRDENLLAWRSEDGGKTWSGPTKVNSAPKSAREGLHHMAAAADGTVCCVWLDLRANKTQVYGAFSKDMGATWANEKVIYESPDGSVCECCQPQVAFDPRGDLHVMWRNNLAASRDMYLSTSKDMGKSFSPAVQLGQDTWKLNACPMDGGALAAGADGKVLTVWMRNKEVFSCLPGLHETSLGKGEQGWVAAGPRGYYLTWIVARPGPVMLLAPGSVEPLRVTELGWDPVVAAPVTGKGPVVLAWEEGKAGSKRIYTAVLGQPK